MRSKVGLVGKVIAYKLFRKYGRPKIMPINITFSVTNKCNSRCKTCLLWQFYRKHPKLKGKEFKTFEFEKTFRSLGKSIFWLTLSGGEPFLRDDLPEICETACKYCEPAIINIPTNCLLGKKIEKLTKEILKKSSNKTEFIINLSLDGIQKKHDEIRGIPGNFEKVMEVYKRLQNLKKEYSNLKIGIHTVVSVFNIDEILNIYEYVKKNLNPDSYITEIAEERVELSTVGKKITPDVEKYRNVITQLIKRINEDYMDKEGISKITQKFRTLYYQMVPEILMEKKQIIPCYAGFASCQIDPFGNIWPCCILASTKSFGNLRDVNFDFKKIWKGKKTEVFRNFVRNKQCFCPMANASYTNILCDFNSIFKIIMKECD